MPYSAEVSRTNPACIVFLIDQSGSMRNQFAGDSDTTKAEAVADAINRFLQNLVIMCTKQGGVRDFYHIGVIGYGQKVGSVLCFDDDDCDDYTRNLVPISEMAENPSRIEERKKTISDGVGGLVEHSVKFPVWFDPVAYGRTFMGDAIDLCVVALEDFIEANPNCYPPIVINITDGAADPDSPPEEPATRLRSLESTDGNVLMFNIHISHLDVQTIDFPDTDSHLADEYARLLFSMSSRLPPSMLEMAQREEFAVTENSRGFVFNGNLVSVIRFIDIGTRHTRMRRLGHTP